MSEDLNNEVPENMEGEEIDNIVILNNVFEIFKEKFKDEFNFTD